MYQSKKGQKYITVQLHHLLKKKKLKKLKLHVSYIYTSFKCTVCLFNRDYHLTLKTVMVFLYILMYSALSGRAIYNSFTVITVMHTTVISKISNEAFRSSA